MVQQELPYPLLFLISPVETPYLAGRPIPSNHIYNKTTMMQAVPLKRSLSRSFIRVIQRALPLVKSRRRSWTTNAKIRMPIDL